MFITSTPTSNDVLRFASESANPTELIVPAIIGVVLAIFLFAGLISAVVAQNSAIKERYQDIVR